MTIKSGHILLILIDDGSYTIQQNELYFCSWFPIAKELAIQILSKWLACNMNEQEIKSTSRSLTKIEAHEEVGEGEVGNEKPGDVQLGASECEDYHHSAIPQQGQQEHYPHPA